MESGDRWTAPSLDHLRSAQSRHHDPPVPLQDDRTPKPTLNQVVERFFPSHPLVHRKHCPSPGRPPQSVTGILKFVHNPGNLLSSCRGRVLGTLVGLRHGQLGLLVTSPQIGHWVPIVHDSPVSRPFGKLASPSVLPCFLLRVKHLSLPGQTQALGPGPFCGHPL